MKSYLKALLLLLIVPFFVFSQSLSPERIFKIKSCTVRVTIEGTNSMGTGFFITENGAVLTCWHVIEPAFKRDSLTNVILSMKKIFAVLNTGQKIEMGIYNACLGNGYEAAVAYDFCVLQPLNKQNSPFLKLGSFSTLKEGQEIYTCGFPVSIEQQFVSKGIVSTIFVDTLNSVTNNGKIKKMPRTQALLDITLNSGNSGGAIIKVGNTVDDDEVIGLADFIINPIGQNNAKDMIDLFSKGVGKYSLEGVDPNKAFIYFTQILSSMSLGVSGCISIDHFLTSLGKTKN